MNLFDSAKTEDGEVIIGKKYEFDKFLSKSNRSKYIFRSITEEDQ